MSAVRSASTERDPPFLVQGLPDSLIQLFPPALQTCSVSVRCGTLFQIKRGEGKVGDGSDNC